uniref:Uncharacterized protein n=1 Tax=Catagonus wagneri TaxID=51154 RepID=A0A8C3YIR6_9CETA
MSGHHLSHSSTYSHLNHPNNVSFLTQTPGWSHSPNVTGDNLKHSLTVSGSEMSSSPSEQSKSPSSPRLPVRRICMGRPYNSTCVEMSHLASCPKVARKPACRGSPRCLLCTDRPSGPSSPTFLDQLIKGINYLDRSTSAFYSHCPKLSLSLPRLAASYLERAANAIHLDYPDPSFSGSHSNSSTRVAASDNPCASSCMVPSTRRVSALQCVDDSTSTSCPHRLHSQSFAPMLPLRPGTKLPELPLFGNGIFSLGRLPKFWEAIRSSWRAPEPISKPCSWW